jgi:hypothetical protein
MHVNIWEDGGTSASLYLRSASIGSVSAIAWIRYPVLIC